MVCSHKLKELTMLQTKYGGRKNRTKKTETKKTETPVKDPYRNNQ